MNCHVDPCGIIRDLRISMLRRAGCDFLPAVFLIEISLVSDQRGPLTQGLQNCGMITDLTSPLPPQTQTSHEVCICAMWLDATRTKGGVFLVRIWTICRVRTKPEAPTRRIRRLHSLLLRGYARFMGNMLPPPRGEGLAMGWVWRAIQYSN